ncbi:hypothetical protein EON81_30340 [bacterium]|nr:MAG: hypothetical protein EON81_30340 [bacterium]
MAQRRDPRFEIASPIAILAIVAVCLFGSYVSGGDRSEAMDLGARTRTPQTQVARAEIAAPHAGLNP